MEKLDKELRQLKVELKAWESMFRRKHGRKPLKEDIDESSIEVKESYKTYNSLKLKKSTLEKESINAVTKIDDGVFGDDLMKGSVKQKISEVEKKVLLKHDPIMHASRRPSFKRWRKCANDENVEEQSKEIEVIKPSDDVMCLQIEGQTERKNQKKRKSSTALRLQNSLFSKYSNISSEWLDTVSNTIMEKDNSSRVLDPVIDKDLVVNHTSSPLNGLLSDTVREEITENSHKPDHCSSLQEPDCAPSQKLDFAPLISEKSDGDLKTLQCEKTEISKPVPMEILISPQKKKEKESNEICDASPVKPKQKAKRKRVEKEVIESDSKKVKLSKVQSQKLVSKNFIKIDLRKKTYVRGLKKLTGAQYKRKQWKQKTSFEMPIKKGWQTIGYKKTCFKCGGEGHWAKFCRGKSKKVDPFTKLAEEKNSLDFEGLNLSAKSCFDYLRSKENVSACKKEFCKDDVLDIAPRWPRTPYVTDQHEQTNNPLIPSADGNPSQEAFDLTKEALKKFGFHDFREGQHLAVSRIISGLSTLVILSTGSGKSLCYQLPAYMFYTQRKAMTLVVSPLVALMQDQVAGLPSFLPGACLNSNMTKLRQKRVIENIKAGKVAVLLVSPEALVSGGFGAGLLPGRTSLPDIAFACIDEAHCLSEWSHNFRPSYLKVCKVLRERYNIGCLLGLTATASQTSAQSVIRHLGITGDASIIRDPQPIPANLSITASRDERRDEALVELLQIKPFSLCDSIIVYVTRRTEADRLAVLLRTSLPDRLPGEDKESAKEDKKKSRKKSSCKPFWWNVECYHAGLSPAQRRRVQSNFMSGELRIVVATVAFGMGLDKCDVRAVVHFNMPASFENYVQEIGRAGRDGKPAFVHVFLDDQGNDLNELRRHIHGNTVDRSTIHQFVDLAFPACNCAQKATEETRQDLSDSELEMFFADDFDGETVDGGLRIDEPTTNKCASHRPETESSGQILPVNTNLFNPPKTDANFVHCTGHRISFNIDRTVEDLDMPEVNISTLLAYLELHPKRWLRVLNPLRAVFAVKCYGGPEQFQLLARRFAPIAVALRLKDEWKGFGEMREITFNICEVADAMCWDVFTVARETRALQWNLSFALDAELNTTGNSGIIIEGDGLSFHLVTSTGIGDAQKDDICDFLHEAVEKQEERRDLQLDALYNVLRELSHEHYWQVKEGLRVDATARECVNKYFLSDGARQCQVLREMCACQTRAETPSRRWNNISSDIGALVCAHPDLALTGRAVARIFHGIDSPRYPAWSFGKDRRFWRQYLDVEFNELRKFAVMELTKYRR